MREDFEAVASLHVWRGSWTSQVEMPRKPLKILVVDDDQNVATAIGRVLHAHQPAIETDFENAYRRLNDGEWFDVVVCDVTLPERASERLLATARALSNPPIFLLASSDGTLKNVEADMTIHEQFTVAQLMDAVTIALGKKSRATTLPIPRVSRSRP